MGLFGVSWGEDNFLPGRDGKKESKIVDNQKLTKEQKKQKKEQEKRTKEQEKEMETILQFQKMINVYKAITFEEAMKEHGWRNSSSYIMALQSAENMILNGTANDESEHYRKTLLEKMSTSITNTEPSWQFKTYIISILRESLGYPALLNTWVTPHTSIADVKKTVDKRARIFANHVKLSADNQKLLENFMVRYPPEKILHVGMGLFISYTASKMENYSTDDIITMIFDITNKYTNDVKLEEHEESLRQMFFQSISGVGDSFWSGANEQKIVQRSVDTQERFFNDFFKLYDLLIEENMILSIHMLVTLLISSAYDSHAKKLEQDILGEEPKNISDFIHAFLMHYPDEEDRQRLLPQFRTILNQSLHDTGLFESNQHLTIESIKEEIRLAEKKLQRDSFKKSLLAGEPSKTMLDLDVLTGIEFEHFLVKMFEKMGYKCEVTKASGAFGADLLLNKVGVRTVVQAKRYDCKVSPKAVQEAVAAIKQYDANDAMVVTTNYFTSGANELADNNNVKLVDRDKIEEWLKKYQI